MLPFIPEPLEQLKARYQDAIRVVLDCDEIAANPEIRPGAHRRHVFDMECGARLIISRERKRDGKKTKQFIHVSCSQNVENGKIDVADIPGLFWLISNDHRELFMVGMSQKGVCHFVIEE